jgi:glucose-1-phosphate cytidylyltransferase
MMKVVILAGGLGTRLSEETALKPKPMVEIGGKPILWHIMKHYSHYGYNDFIICCGYKGYMIKEYFANYNLHTSDVTIDLESNEMITHKKKSEPWKVTLIDTGDDTLTGGRLLRVKKYLGDKTFMLTYGDGLSNVNLDELLEAHRIHNHQVTITAVKPPLRFGILDIDDGYNVTSFKEKPEGDGKYINGGFMVCETDIFTYIDNDKTALEKTPLSQMSEHGKMGAYLHHGFWYAMDTIRDKQHLEELWQQGNAEWKVWE